MLSQFILEHSTAHDDEVIVTPHTSVGWHQLRDQTLLMVAAGESLRKRRVGLCLGSSSQSYAVLAALDKLNCDSFLFDERLAMEEVIRLASNLRLGAVVQPQKRNNGSALEIREIENEENGSGNSTVTILTSGTSGQPKAASHSWESLGRPIRRGTNQSAPRWLMTYRPNLYAGLQVMLQCFADRGTLACPDSEMEPGSVVQFMTDSRVQYVSATPS